MSDNNFTKGEWERGKTVDLSVYSSDDQRLIADCRVVHRGYGVCEANANLIAAAPDLLEALEELTKFIEFASSEYEIPINIDIAKAEAALKKARGEK